MPDTSDILLDEMRELRSAFNEFSRKCEARLTALETDNYAVMGNGQPGRLNKAEDAIQGIRQRIWWCLGAVAGVSGLLSLVAWVVKG
jgi:hypothetical protein